MRKLIQRHRPGFLLLEVLLGIVVFALFLTAVSMVMLTGQESSVMAGDRYRGLQVSLRGIEAARSIRDGSFANLTAGSHGIELNPFETWTLTGAQSTVTGSYTNRLDITSLGTGWTDVLSTVTWQHGRFLSGSVVLRTELTDWRTSGTLGDWTSAVLDGSYVPGGTPLFTGLTIAGNTAYLTGDTASGGAGLYVVDITDTTSPSRIAPSFTLGAPAYGAAVKGSALFLVTGDASQEIRIYNVSTPASPTLHASYNLSGSSLAASLALDGRYLYVGAQQDALYDEFYAFDAASTGAILPLDSLAQAATVNAIALSGTGAYLAVNDAAGEMIVVNVADPSALALDSNGTYNLTSSEVGRSVALTGTSGLLGRQRGAAIQEMVLFTPGAGGGAPPATDVWYHEGSGSLLGVDMDPFACYGFLAADSNKKALQIVNLRDTASLPELWTYNSVNGPARAVLYDPVRDRVFVLTSSALLIFRPISTTGSCS